MLLAVFCYCTDRFVSDLFGNHIVGFPTRRLKFCRFRSDAFELHAIASLHNREGFVFVPVRYLHLQVASGADLSLTKRDRTLPFSITLCVDTYNISENSVPELCKTAFVCMCLRPTTYFFKVSSLEIMTLQFITSLS